MYPQKSPSFPTSHASRRWVVRSSLVRACGDGLDSPMEVLKPRAPIVDHLPSLPRIRSSLSPRAASAAPFVLLRIASISV